MLILPVIILLSIRSSESIKAIPGQPIPHAAILDELLTKYLGPSYTYSDPLELILGHPDGTNDTNLDVKVLDVENVIRTIKFAKRKYDKDIVTINEKNGRRASPGDAYHWDQKLVDKLAEFIKQTIYFIKERVNETIPFRKKYIKDISYEIAVLYGAASTILGKMESLLAQMKQFWWRTHFIWFLITYQRILACNIDIDNSIERIFLLHLDFAKRRGPKQQLEGMEGMPQGPPGRPGPGPQGPSKDLNMMLYGHMG